MAEELTPARCKLIAAQFFAIFDDDAPDALSGKLNGLLSGSTIRRDRERLRNGQPPSEASARVYLDALSKPDSVGLQDLDALEPLADLIIAKRRAFHAQFTPDPYVTGAPVHYPPYWSRAVTRFDEGEWLSVIDILEPQLSGRALKELRASKHAEAEPYLRHHIGLAHLNRGEAALAIKHFREGVRLLWSVNSDARRDIRYHLAVDLALNLLSAPTSHNAEDEIVTLISHVINDRLPHPNMVANLVIIAVRLDDKWSGYLTGRLEESLERARDHLDFDAALSTMLQDVELKSYHSHAMFQTIEAALRRQAPQTKE